MLESEFPKLFIFWTQLSMVSGVFVTSTIAHPHIVPSICQHESWSLILIIYEPGIRRVQESVLEDDRFESAFDDRVFFLDAEDGQDVSIFCGDCVFLNWIVEVFAVVLELKF